MSVEAAISIQTLNKTNKELIFISTYDTWYNLVARTSGSNSSGAGTFSKPDGFSDWLEIIGVGGGGGGGGMYWSGATRYGGGGGCSGAIKKCLHKYVSLYSYQIGLYGSGGIAGSSPTDGSYGGPTYITYGIGNKVFYTPIAGGGQKGTSTSGGKGGGLFFDTVYPPTHVQYILEGGDGGDSSPSNGSNGQILNLGEFYVGSGGGGCEESAAIPGNGGGLSYDIFMGASPTLYRGGGLPGDNTFSGMYGLGDTGFGMGGVGGYWDDVYAAAQQGRNGTSGLILIYGNRG